MGVGFGWIAVVLRKLRNQSAQLSMSMSLFCSLSCRILVRVSILLPSDSHFKRINCLYELERTTRSNGTEAPHLAWSLGGIPSPSLGYLACFSIKLIKTFLTRCDVMNLAAHHHSFPLVVYVHAARMEYHALRYSLNIIRLCSSFLSS